MKIKFNKKPLVVASLLVPGFLWSSGSAFAALEEIIVTANKRAESANEIGMSITAISGQKLAEQKLTSLEEITSSVPGLVFANSQQNTPILTLRGVGFNESSLGVYPATSLYVDEIPLPFPVMAAHSAYDLERVEVLKGPQGVLFGQNSTGGAVNFIAAKPTEELSYGGDISYGRFNRFETNAFVSGSLGEMVAGRLAIQNVQSDDWQQSLTRDAENGEDDYTAARLSLRFQPTDAAEINLNVNGWRDKSDPQAMQLAAAMPKAFAAAPENALRQVSAPFTEKDNRSADWTDELSGDKEFMQYSLRGDFDLNDSTTLTALVAHSSYEQDQIQDADGQALEVDGYRNVGDIDSTFAEIRLGGMAGDNLNWVVGANYEDSSTEEYQVQSFRDNTSSRPGTLMMNRVGLALEQEIESYAFFGNIDYSFTESLTLKLGARYTDTTIDALACTKAAPNGPNTTDNSGFGSNVGALFNILGGMSGNPFTPIGLNDCFTLNNDGVPGFPFVDELAEDNISWRAGLDYQFDENTLLYANVSQGYKAGSYPVISASSYAQLQPVTEESVLSYEAGFKKSMIDNRIQWNGAAFYYEYEDKQVRGKTLTPIFGALDRLVNVPESTIIGLETDIVALLGEYFTVTAAVTYVDSEVDKYTGYNVFGQIVDFAGESLPYTPEFTYSLDLDYRTPLSQGGTLFMGVNVTGQSKTDAVFDGDDIALNPDNVAGGFQKSITENFLVVDSYAVVGARLGYESSDERWKIMVWGKNITDEYYFNSVTATSDSGARMAGRPRTYGLTVGYNF